MKRQIRICRDRLLEDGRTLQEWMKDPNFKDKVNAMHLSAEIAAAVIRLYDSGPGLLSKRHAFPHYNSLTEREGTTGARLVLKKQSQQSQPQQQQEGEYYDDKLGYSEDEEKKDSYGFD